VAQGVDAALRWKGDHLAEVEGCSNGFVWPDVRQHAHDDDDAAGTNGKPRGSSEADGGCISQLDSRNKYTAPHDHQIE